MSADGTDGAVTVRQPGHPNLLGPRWEKGQSGNRSGLSKYQAKLSRAIRRQERPKQVCEVIAAMREDALAHEKYSAAAAKVYLAAVGIDIKPKADLAEVLEAMRGAPDEALQWFVAVKGRLGG